MTTRTLAFVGSLTRDTPFFAPSRGTGISTFAFDEETGALDLIAKTGGTDNPTYLAIDAVRPTLYAASEVFEWHEGEVTAYAIDAGTGHLTYVNKQPTLGHLSAFLSLDTARTHLLVSNYSMQAPDVRPGKSLVVLPVDDNGIRPAMTAAMRSGNGPVADRQERAHAHCMVMGPDGLIAVADLGTDDVSFYRLDEAAGALRGPVSRVVLPPGSGPRHVVFAGDGRTLYVVNELACTAAVLRRDAFGDDLALVQIVSSLPDGADLGSRAAGLALSPNGRHLFVSNRGHDSVASFAVETATGRLSFRGTWPSGGTTPRSLTIDPSGRFVVVANQDGDNLTVLRIDANTGALTATGGGVATASPMCIAIVRLVTAPQWPGRQSPEQQ